jgi:hypothetical protein
VRKAILYRTFNLNTTDIPSIQFQGTIYRTLTSTGGKFDVFQKKHEKLWIARRTQDFLSADINFMWFADKTVLRFSLKNTPQRPKRNMRFQLMYDESCAQCKIYRRLHQIHTKNVLLCRSLENALLCNHSGERIAAVNRVITYTWPVNRHRAPPPWPSARETSTLFSSG